MRPLLSDPTAAAIAAAPARTHSGQRVQTGELPSASGQKKAIDQSVPSAASVKIEKGRRQWLPGIFDRSCHECGPSPLRASPCAEERVWGILRRSMLQPRMVVGVFIAAALALAGCKGNCRKLSERLCDCQPNSFLKDDCNRRAANEESRVGTKPADEVRCGALLNGCDCHTIDTPEGKRSCGLARSPP